MVRRLRKASTINAHLTALSLLLSESPAVDTVRQTLAVSSDKWFHRLVISSLIVGIGVGFELPEATLALKRWYAL